MTFSHKHQTVTYIVRIWAEYLDETPPRWRGVVASIGEETPLHFSGLDEMVALIRQQTQSRIEKETEP